MPINVFSVRLRRWRINRGRQQTSREVREVSESDATKVFTVSCGGKSIYQLPFQDASRSSELRRSVRQRAFGMYGSGAKRVQTWMGKLLRHCGG